MVFFFKAWNVNLDILQLWLTVLSRVLFIAQALDTTMQPLNLHFTLQRCEMWEVLSLWLWNVLFKANHRVPNTVKNKLTGPRFYVGLFPTGVDFFMNIHKSTKLYKTFSEKSTCSTFFSTSFIYSTMCSEASKQFYCQYSYHIYTAVEIKAKIDHF